MTENYPARCKRKSEQLLKEQALREQIPINKNIISEFGFKQSDSIKEFYKDIAKEKPDLPFANESENSDPLLDPQETTSPFEQKGTYRAQFMQGKENEYSATIEAFRKMASSSAGSRLHALDLCRRFAHFAMDSATGDVRVMTDSCRQRWCPMCGSQKSKYAKESTKSWIEKLDAPRFLTLTLRNEEGDLLPQIQFLQDCFKRLRQRAYWKKNVTGGIWFMQIKRAKNSGCWHPHFHILLDGKYMEQGVLSDLWDQVTYGSPIIDIRVIHNPEESAGYVARYSARPANLEELDIDDRVEIIEALHGKRLSGTFGTAKCVTLTPPKVEDGGDWQHVGYYDTVVSDSTTNRAAAAILEAWKNDRPLPQWAFNAYTDKGEMVLKNKGPANKVIQLTLDFFNTG